jgi:hypothetical protein
MHSVSGHLDENVQKIGPVDPITQETYLYYKNSFRKGQDI